MINYLIGFDKDNEYRLGSDYSQTCNLKTVAGCRKHALLMQKASSSIVKVYMFPSRYYTQKVCEMSGVEFGKYVQEVGTLLVYAPPKEYRFWNINNAEKFKRSVEGAKEDLLDKVANEEEEECYEIVEIYVGDASGQYVMREFTCRMTGMEEEFYHDRYEDENGNLDVEKEIWDFDILMEEVNEELIVFLEELGIDMNFFTMYVQWNEGAICLIMYPQS